MDALARVCGCGQGERSRDDRCDDEDAGLRAPHPHRISTMTGTTLTPARLWKRMTPDQRHRAARAFWHDENAADDQIQAVLLISQQKKFRPKTVIGLDEERKVDRRAALLVNRSGRTSVPAQAALARRECPPLRTGRRRLARQSPRVRPYQTQT